MYWLVITRIFNIICSPIIGCGDFKIVKYTFVYLRVCATFITVKIMAKQKLKLSPDFQTEHGLDCIEHTTL